jgi:hypothetical protein
MNPTLNPYADRMEPVSAEDLAELERDRERLRVAAGRESRMPSPSRRGPTPLQDLEPVAPPDCIPADTPRYTPPLVAVDLAGVTLHMHPSRLELRKADLEGRRRAAERIDQARAQFAAGETWQRVLALRKRRQDAGTRLSEASLAVQKAEEAHAQAAADDSADAGKRWRTVTKLRENLAGFDAMTSAIAAQLDKAEQTAAAELARVLAEARHAESEAIASTRKQLEAALLEAMKPLLEQMQVESSAASELGRLAARPAALPT